MFSKDFLIKKCPYLAYSPNLMESFTIIGYNERFVPQILDSYKKRKNEHPPAILSTVTSDSEFGTVDNKFTISQIYPDNPIVILVNKNDINEEPPPTTNVIYSFSIDSTDGKKKSIMACFGFKFYEKYKVPNTNEEYYIPKAFCIISQYYYFTIFEYICKNILKLMEIKESNSLPVEITIFNIVNFIPSPVNYRLRLDLFNFSSLKVPEIDLPQLSGYPYLDFDLNEIFNLLPLNLIVEIYFVTMLEQNILFFSSNLELLNIVMFIMYILNYPCNDTPYFWHIISFSKDNFTEENKFVGKRTPSLLGINCSYNEEFDTSAFGNYHFIVDIDNKTMEFKQADQLVGEEIKEFDDLQNLYDYIQNVNREKEKNNDNSFLRIIFGKLKIYLELFLSRKPEFTTNPKNKYVCFNKTSKEITELNKRIQEIFYDCTLNILLIFYQENTLNSSFDKIKKDSNISESIKRYNKIRKIDENTPLSKEENCFCILFQETHKYKIYFENFILNFESIDAYKIPLIFSEEFINIKIKDKNNSLMKISTFKIIDSLYLPKEQESINITFNNIFADYFEKLQKKFKCFFTPEKLKLENSRQLKILNKKIINKYIYLLKHYYQKEELLDLFPSMKIQQKMEISTFDRRIIAEIIQNNLEEKDLIEASDYLIYSLVYIFCISISLHSYDKMLNYITATTKAFEKMNFSLRHYIYIIIKSFYKYYLVHKEKHIYPDVNVSSLKMYYYMLINCLKDNLIIPNEEMMSIVSLFFGTIIFQERESINANMIKEQIDKDANFTIEKNINFFCILKYCFTNKKMFKPHIMIRKGMLENSVCNMIISVGDRQIQPKIQIKIKEYNYMAEFFSAKKIYKNAKNAYLDLFGKKELDISKLNIKNIRDTITNLIQYYVVFNEYNNCLPVDYLIYTLYLLKDFEEKSND